MDRQIKTVKPHAEASTVSPSELNERYEQPLKEITMQAHQQRVIEEKTELDKKLLALCNFIGGNAIFDTLDLSEQERLKSQEDIMCQYSEILGARLSAAGICPQCYEEGMDTLDGIYGCAECGHTPDAE